MSFGNVQPAPNGMMEHHPMTREQRQTLEQNLTKIMETLGDVQSLLRASYGEGTSPAYRAGEALGALQRLIWALERHAQPVAAKRASS